MIATIEKTECQECSHCAFLAELVHVSKGNKKLGSIPNVSLLPIVTCNPLAPCAKKGECYALKALIYPQAARAWRENTEQANADPRAFAQTVGAWIDSQRQPVKQFRIHVAGDFFSQEYYDAMLDMIKARPQTRFLAFTKQYSLNFGDIPENFSLIISAWPGLDIPEEKLRLHRKAWLNDSENKDDRIPSDAIKCPGSCETCSLCFHLPTIDKDVVFDKH